MKAFLNWCRSRIPFPPVWLLAPGAIVSAGMFIFVLNEGPSHDWVPFVVATVFGGATSLALALIFMLRHHLFAVAFVVGFIAEVCQTPFNAKRFSQDRRVVVEFSTGRDFLWSIESGYYSGEKTVDSARFCAELVAIAIATLAPWLLLENRARKRKPLHERRCAVCGCDPNCDELPPPGK